MMNKDERDLIINAIAGQLDMPSLYMSGPSQQSKRRAERIVEWLEHSQRLVTTTCDHSDYVSYRENGIYCPRCNLKIKEIEE
jgi:hypothetical protein